MERKTTNIFPLPPQNPRVIFEFPFWGPPLGEHKSAAKRSNGFYVFPEQ